MEKKEIIRTLVLSPLYWMLKLKDRAELVKSMIPRQQPNGSYAADQGAQT